MSEKTLNARIINKHDIEANWIKATGFVPKQGEIIIYDVDSTHTHERFKIGDGTTVVSSLPFADDALRASLETQISEAISKIPAQVQSDWDQIDETAEDVIKNKPDEDDAFAFLEEMGLIRPALAADGSAYVDENGAFYSII